MLAKPSLALVMQYGGREDLNAALRASTFLAAYEIARYRLPRLYTPGLVQYRWPEPCPVAGMPGDCERFLTPRAALEEGGLVDCDDVAPWRCAEILLQDSRRSERCKCCGQPLPRQLAAQAEVINAPGVGWHAVVRHADGSIEDPSRVVGMK